MKTSLDIMSVDAKHLRISSLPSSVTQACSYLHLVTMQCIPHALRYIYIGKAYSLCSNAYG